MMLQQPLVFIAQNDPELFVVLGISVVFFMHDYKSNMSGLFCAKTADKIPLVYLKLLSIIMTLFRGRYHAASSCNAHHLVGALSGRVSIVYSHKAMPVVL